MWSFPLAKIPILQHICQSTFPSCHHPLCIHNHRDYVDTAGRNSLDSIHVSKLLAQDALSLSNPVPLFVPDVGECLDDLGKAIRRTTGQYYLWASCIRYVRVQVLPNELTDEGVEWWI